MGLPANIDIIILSYAKSDLLKQMTIDAINSLETSENSEKIIFNTVVLESNKALKPFQYPRTTTIYPEEAFGYNKYLNIGIQMTHNSYVCLCNNDLIFHKNWATEILEAFDQHPELSSANPYSENFGYADEI